jgi:glutaredoxin
VTSRGRVTLYSKPGCHLCEDARTLLDELQPEFAFDVTEIDIRTDAEVFTRYRHEIPVVVLDGVEVARGLIDERVLLQAFEKRRTVR